MMMRAVSIRAVIFFACIMLLCSPESAHAVIYGSETAVSVQPNVTFPAADTDNTMLGFGWFKNGFILQDSTTSCTFDSVFPVSGTVNLNGGTLYLNQDLIFHNATSLLGLGSIIARNNNKLIEFCSTVTYLPDDGDLFDNVALFFDHDLVLNTALRFRNECIIDGRGNTLNLGLLGSLVVEPNSRLIIKNIEIEGISGFKIRCVDGTSSLVLDEAKIVLDGDFSVTTGSISYMENVVFQGNYTFTYENIYTSTIRSDSSLYFTEGIRLSTGKAHANANQPFYFEDDTAILGFDNAKFTVLPNGITLTRGILDLCNAVELDVHSTNTLDGFILGDGDIAEDITVRFNAASLLNHVAGHFVYNNGSPHGIVSTSLQSRLKRYPGSQIFVAKDVTLPPFTVEFTTLTVADIQIGAGVILLNNDTVLETPIGLFQATAQRFSATQLALNGNNRVAIIRGTLPRALVVSGTNNTIFGNGNTGAPIALLAPTAQLSMGLNGQMLANMSLGGGTAALTSDLRLGPGVVIAGSGTINLNAVRLLIGNQPTTWATNLNWQSNGGSIMLLSNTTVNATWNFSGNTVIDGQGSTLTLGASGNLVVNNGAHITLKNIIIKGVKDTNIRCLNNAASITYDNAILLFDGDTNFDTGSIEIANSVDFSGSYTFLYDSPRTSTIDLKAKWEFSNGIVLSVGKEDENDPDPIAFEGDTSVLSLNDCSLIVRDSGVRITKGIIACWRDVAIDIAATATTQGLILGNGIVGDDVTLELNPGTTVRLNSGVLVYDVTENDGIKARSKTATLIRGDDSIIHVNEDLTLSDMTVVAEPLATLNVVAGKTLSYDQLTAAQVDGEFEIIGSRVNFFTNLLSGNDSIFLNKGTLSSYLTIDGTNNILQGNGVFTGPIIFNDSAAQLIYELNGIAGNSIFLNGGLLQLTRDLDFTKGFALIGPGTIDAGTNKVSFGHSDLTLTSTINWVTDDTTITMRSNINLSGTWYIQGVCSIKGNGNTLTLQNGGQIIAGPDTVLEFSDIDIRGIMNNNIACIDDDSVIVLDGVIWYQDGNYTFSMGALQFKNDVFIIGNSTFAYQTAQTSTILTRSNLDLDAGITFSYDPIVNASKDLLAFIDDTSVITLNGATLHATVTGWDLTKGKIVVARDSFLSTEMDIVGESLEVNEGITFGNNNGTDDLTVNILDGTTLKLVNGLLNYRNVNTASWIMDTNTSILYLNPNTRLNLWETLSLEPGVLILDNDTTIGIASGKELIGNVVPLGNYTIVDI